MLLNRKIRHCEKIFLSFKVDYPIDVVFKIGDSSTVVVEITDFEICSSQQRKCFDDRAEVCLIAVNVFRGFRLIDKLHSIRSDPW